MVYHLFSFYDATAYVIIGLLFIIMPLIIVILSNDKKSELVEKLPTIIIGIIILLISPGTLAKWFYIVVGILLALYGTLLILTSIYIQKETDNE